MVDIDFTSATQLFDVFISNNNYYPDLDGSYESHYADVNTRKTYCGLDIGVYSDGWVWGKKDKITCEECEKNINNR